MKRFRACVIGVGFIGAAHIEALRRLGNVDVVAVANTSDAEGKAAANCVPKGYTDYREMLDIEKPDVVHICTPNQTLTLRHEAGTRAMLADGAVDAARFMVGKPRGMYNMESILQALPG